MLFGSGIELGIGIDTQPDIDTAASINNAIRTAILAKRGRSFFIKKMGVPV